MAFKLKTNTMKKAKQVFIWVSIFSIAMGMLESAVVVYLRELYYPNGFNFPLSMMDGTIALTEILREVATIIMLIAIGIIAGRTKTEKFAYFIYSFAIWDIFYYAFLKALLNWPESLLTWDILFLLPTTWVGPVVAPVILALAMIVLTTAIVYFTNNSLKTHLVKSEWLLLILGSIICIISFTYEYSGYILEEFSLIQMLIPSEKLMNYAIGFVPIKFPWIIFLSGTLTIIAGIGLFIYRNLKIKNEG